MARRSKAVWIYFPPRLLKTRGSFGPHAQLDEVAARYITAGVAVLDNEESMKNVMKIIEFAQQFDDILPFDRRKKGVRRNVR